MSDLHIERDADFLDAERIVHRIGVVLMTLAVAAGALGFFGYGPLSTATRIATGYTVTYDRFARNGAEFSVLLQQTGAEPLQVWIDTALLDATQPDRVVPEASEERPDDRGVTFVFDDEGGTDRQANFHFTGDTIGLIRGQVGRSPDDTVPVSAFFYP